MNLPVHAEVVLMFLPAGEGGRDKAVSLRDGVFRPQLVVAGSAPLTVAFVDGPIQAVRAGETAAASISFIGVNGASHDALRAEAAFKVMDGGRIVAIGRVVRRTQAEVG